MEELTEDECIQLSYIAAGWSMADISSEFSESISSTKRRQTIILRKLGARNSTHAVAIAIRDRQIV